MLRRAARAIVSSNPRLCGIAARSARSKLGLTRVFISSTVPPSVLADRLRPPLFPLPAYYRWRASSAEAQGKKLWAQHEYDASEVFLWKALFLRSKAESKDVDIDLAVLEQKSKTTGEASHKEFEDYLKQEIDRTSEKSILGPTANFMLLHQLGSLYGLTGKLAMADKLYRKLLSFLELVRTDAEFQTSNVDPTTAKRKGLHSLMLQHFTAVFYNELGRVVNDSGNVQDAENYYKRSLRLLESIRSEIQTRVPGDTKKALPEERILEKFLPETLTLEGVVCANLGMLYEYENRHEEALRYHLRLLSAQCKALIDYRWDHPHIVSSTLYKMQRIAPAVKRAISLSGKTNFSRRDFEKAGSQHFAPNPTDIAAEQTTFERLVALQEKHLGGDHPAMIPALYRLAYLCIDLRRLSEADLIFRKILQIQSKRPGGADSVAAATALAGLAQACRADKQFDKADRWLSKAIEIKSRQLPGGAKHLHVGLLGVERAELLAAQGKGSEAADAFDAALATMKNAGMPAVHPWETMVAGSAVLERNTLAVANERKNVREQMEAEAAAGAVAANVAPHSVK